MIVYLYIVVYIYVVMINSNAAAEQALTAVAPIICFVLDI